jgi:hypothetical protein
MQPTRSDPPICTWLYQIVSFFQMYPPRACVLFSFPDTSHMPRPAPPRPAQPSPFLSPRSTNFNNFRWEVQIMKLFIIQFTRVSCFFVSRRRHEHVGMLNLLCLFLGQRTLKCRMILKMTRFSWLCVHQILWQCAILNLLLCNTCLRHWLLQYLYSHMNLVYNCKHSKEKICTLVIFRGAVHRTKFNIFNAAASCVITFFAFLRSTSE